MVSSPKEIKYFNIGDYIGNIIINFDYNIGDYNINDFDCVTLSADKINNIKISGNDFNYIILSCDNTNYIVININIDKFYISF